jgi:hypothetical protein
MMFKRIAIWWGGLSEQYKRIALEGLKGALVVNGPLQLALVNDFGLESHAAEMIIKYGSLALSAAAFIWQIKSQTDYSITTAASKSEGVVVSVDVNRASSGAIAAAEASKFPDVMPITEGDHVK